MNNDREKFISLDEKTLDEIGNQFVQYTYLKEQWQKVYESEEVIENLQTENKQLREQLHIERARIQQAIEYIKNNVDNTGWLEIGSVNVKELLEILGDKENE